MTLPRQRLRALAPLTLLLTTPLLAGTRTWSGGAAPWNVNTNWQESAVPDQGDGVIISQPNAAVTYVNNAAVKPMYAALDVSTPTPANTAALSQSQSVLNTSRLFVGITGKGAVDLSAGTLNVAGIDGLSLGSSQGGNGTLTLRNTGTLNVAGQALIGDTGVGTFTQSGGTFVVNPLGPISGQVLLAASANATGAYTLSAGALTTDSIQLAPYGGNAIVAQSSGSVTIRPDTDLSDLSVGDPSITPASGTSVYDHTGGSIDTPALRIGQAGRFKQSGGALRTKALTINTAGGKLDVNHNLIVDYDPADASPAATIRAYLTSGYHNGAWDGGGIMSSTAAANSTRAVGYAEAAQLLNLTGAATQAWNGQAVDATTILIRHTFAGDANLDGKVDFNDLIPLAQNYNAVGNRTWLAGDFNYDNNVDFNDLVKLAQNYNAALPGEPIPGASLNFDADLAAAFATVPEPGAMATVAILATIPLTRRRRQRL